MCAQRYFNFHFKNTGMLQIIAISITCIIAFVILFIAILAIVFRVKLNQSIKDKIKIGEPYCYQMLFDYRMLNKRPAYGRINMQFGNYASDYKHVTICLYFIALRITGQIHLSK